jgi:putative membrane protein insertion efficiency factor
MSRPNVADRAEPDEAVSLPARALSGLVRAYRALTAGRPSPCRFEPTCSAYALEALHEHGACRGSFLAVRRIGRCHPGGRYGYDPVPERRLT